ncbi:myosin-IIIb-like isoform X2 [Odontomachus brunneus]|nr:myosin-IIIb-like isoform X2 [Odontomachus brunneus]XP_032682961.1 myosin-IIIb-like isoform X2 [Odontomachus brunneus]XP_032682962.1 myosin-IIIb-like isoform X2 [Odontomachus brunneus]XP_032682963.1 myosin-IIIb-like isoform X2 [Odontomachus brunneus]XP_032682964.1 myosin-IIIb-like isoform X2 [Odontomachus brunneus]XP_032682965.1 myosin-IIIb-like isoform X2 [Odontomachus brunneus]
MTGDGTNMAYHGLSQHVNFDMIPDPGGRFQLEELIGEGTYGEVYAAYDKETNTKVAIKILENVADNIEEIEEEYLVLRDLSMHPNIPLFYGLFLKRAKPGQEEDQLWFVMELCTGGSVTDLVQGLKKRCSRLKDDQIAYILKETVEALIFLHSNHCMHRDVKGHNILLTEEARVKLVDFGVSSHLAATLARKNTSVGTPYWMAPEVIACEQQLDSSYDSRCDVWSIGITAIELAEGDPPLSELHPMRALFQIPRNPPPSLKAPDMYLPELTDFIAECLVKDLEHRPFASELREHPLLMNVEPKVERIRQQLREEIRRQRAEGRVHRQPEVTTKHGKLKTDRKTRPEKMYMDDLAALDMLSEEAIVEQLQHRYEQAQIYTYIGDILVAVNPFTNLGLYTGIEQKRYKGQARSDNPPHIFAVADAAYQALLHQRQNQAIVISGESGAGKTESANLLLKQLVYLSKAPNRNLEERILQINPIMEAFGNATTGINANSSRFGKYLDLTMTKAGKVTGARISVYLLEQSRVVAQAEGERNFHIFYYMYDGLEADNRLSEFFLDSSLRRYHRYLTHHSHTSQTHIDKFQQLKVGFKVLGFQDSEVDTVYRVLAAILHLGDIEFAEVATEDNTDNKSRVIDTAPLHTVSKLLGVEQNDLLEALTSNSVMTRGETITRNNTVAEACTARDAMAKGLYGRLFDWMVNQINCLLCFSRSPNYEPLAIGLLDIFGFENFPRNSFEQLCINIANEQIQYYFNQHIFTWEQQEYMAEGIPVDLVEFSDNRPVLDMLLSKPMGLLALLDEESRFPRATNRSLIEKFHNNIKSKFYVRPKSDAVCFAIHHFAGRVVYQAEGFLEKNRNFLPPEVIQLVRQSQYDMVRFLFQCPITKTGNLYSALQENDSRKSHSNQNTKERYSSRGLASQSRAQQTVATYFRYSLMDLLQKMVSGSPQFVRCIKPNDSKSPRFFDKEKVVKQLRYTGVLETIRIRQNGFSHRIPFNEFLKRYCFLAFGYDERVIANRETCRLLLIRLKMDGWALGKTKVFLKYYHVEFLSKLYEEQLKKIIIVQACVRRWLAKMKFKKQKWQFAVSVVTLQRHIRGWLSRKHTEEMLAQKRAEEENSALIIRNEMKRKAQENTDINRQEGQQQGRKNLEKNDAAIIIQSHFRGYTIRKRFGYELEERFKRILNNYDNIYDGHKALLREGLKHEDAALIVQRWYKKEEKVMRKKPKAKDPIHPKLRQADLIQFSQNVHMKNQDLHKNLRRNKPGIRLSDIEEPPLNYVRPEGFNMVQSILQYRSGTQPDEENTVKYYRDLKEEMSSGSEFEDDEVGWDLPLIRLENDLHPSSRNRSGQILEMSAERRDRAAQGDFAVAPEKHLSDIWHKALRHPSDLRENESSKKNVSTTINDLHSGNNVQSQAGKQRKTDSPHIHDSTGLRFVIDDRYNHGSERQSTFNGHNLVNGHHNPINEYHMPVNGYNIRQTPHKTNNRIVKSQVNISSTVHTELTNGSITTNNGSEKTSGRSSPKPNGYLIKNHQNNVYHKNGINRLSDANDKPAEHKQLQKEDTFNIAANLRQLLRPTVIEKRQEISKVEYDAEDINGPYNFRQLLRPTGYLPTESLRKRKGELVSNRVPLPKDKVPEKHVKRRAPLAPTQNKMVNGKK